MTGGQTGPGACCDVLPAGPFWPAGDHDLAWIMRELHREGARRRL